MSKKLTHRLTPGEDEMIRKDVNEIEKRTFYGFNDYTIYALVNLDNGKRYIGRTEDPRSRIKAHFYGIKTHKHPNKLINKDSDCEFGYEILETGLSVTDGDKEKTYMMFYQTYDDDFGYNGNDPVFRYSKPQVNAGEQ